MSNLRFFMYLRKSSESEERQQASIPAQERELSEFAKRRGLTVIGEPLQETMSAKRPGRPEFNRMLDALADGDADGIICWHLDRLARNPLDGGRLMQALGDGGIKEIITPNRSYTNSDDKLMMAIEFGMSTKYVDDLARNIARGRRQSIDEGRWPGAPKLGYVRDKNLRLLVPDPERFELIRKLFLERMDGVPVLELVRRAREDWGLTTPRRGKAGGKAIGVPQLYRLLRDPFYAGVLSFKGQTYSGKHRPMVTWDEFQTIQTLLDAGQTQTPRPKEHIFTYQGLITCGRCNALVTGERKVNRHGSEYTYYHCCRKRRTYLFCPERCIEESAVDNAVEQFLSSLILPYDVYQLVVELLPELGSELSRAQKEAAARLQRQLDENEKQLRRIRKLCIDEVLKEDEFREERERLLAQERSLSASLQKVSQQVLGIEPLEQGVSFVNQAISGFRSGSQGDKREIVKSVASNLVLKDRKLHISAKKSFALFQKMKGISSLWTNREHVRTLLLEEIQKNYCIEPFQEREKVSKISKDSDSDD